MRTSGWMGFARTELAAVLAALTCSMAVAIPVIGRVGGDSGVQASMNNLATLGMAHVLYALDWDGRAGDLSPGRPGAFGSVQGYNAANNSTHWWAFEPINFDNASVGRFGHFRLITPRRFTTISTGGSMSPRTTRPTIPSPPRPWRLS